MHPGRPFAPPCPGKSPWRHLVAVSTAAAHDVTTLCLQTTAGAAIAPAVLSASVKRRHLRLSCVSCIKPYIDVSSQKLTAGQSWQQTINRQLPSKIR